MAWDEEIVAQAEKMVAKATMVVSQPMNMKLEATMEMGRR